jgi:hypothetical protein
MEKGKKEVLTLNTVTNDLVGGLTTGLGVVGGSVAMKYASGKVNPWIVSGVGILFGIGTRIAANFVDNKAAKDGIKDFSTGILAAGVLDATIKAVKQFAPNLMSTLPAEVQAAIPTSLGGGERVQEFRTPQLYGPGGTQLLNGNVDYMPANVVGSSLLS